MYIDQVSSVQACMKRKYGSSAVGKCEQEPTDSNNFLGYVYFCEKWIFVYMV